MSGTARPVLNAAGGPLGLVERFHPGEHERVEWCLEQMRALGASRLRIRILPGDIQADAGEAWLGWLIPRLSREVELLPCVQLAPPESLPDARTADGAADAVDPVDGLIARFPGAFDAVELGYEPGLPAEALAAAAQRIRAGGLRAVLGVGGPADPDRLRLLGEHGLLGALDAVGLQGSPDDHAGWPAQVEAVRRTLHGFNPSLALWITEIGYSTWRNDPFEQARRFLHAVDLPVERLYWHGLQDASPGGTARNGSRPDPREDQSGLYTDAGTPKLLGRLLASGGVDAVRRVAETALATPALVGGFKPALVTGGAGFIGSNLADRLLSDGEPVLVLDSLARPGVEENLDWLRRRHGARGRLGVALTDLRDAGGVADAAANASSVFHLAGQVAVTTSLVDPISDFEINLRGTVNLLDALRRRNEREHAPVPLVFASTNKVYGDLADIRLSHNEDAYLPVDPELRAHGIGEERPLSFHTPYGCSKGAADQYVLDYARSFGLPLVVLRMSCIYGPHQLGTEDQGWLAHFILSALQDRPLSIYGDGRQVRDVLEVGDAVSAYLAARERAPLVAGEAFNLGGGADNAITLLMLLDEIERLTGRPVERSFHPWRTGDQRYFVADTRRAREVLGLARPLPWRDGVARLKRWIETERPHLVRGGNVAVPAAEPALGA